MRKPLPDKSNTDPAPNIKLRRCALEDARTAFWAASKASVERAATLHECNAVNFFFMDGIEFMGT